MIEPRRKRRVTKRRGIQLTLSPEAAKRLDELAKFHKCSRSQMVEHYLFAQEVVW